MGRKLAAYGKRKVEEECEGGGRPPRLGWQLLGDGRPRGEAMVAQRMVVRWDSGGGSGAGRGLKRGVGTQSGDLLGFSWWVGAHSQEGEAEGSGVAPPTSHPASLLSARRLPKPQRRGGSFLRTSQSALTSALSVWLRSGFRRRGARSASPYTPGEASQVPEQAAGPLAIHARSSPSLGPWGPQWGGGVPRWGACARVGSGHPGALRPSACPSRGG